MIDPRQCQRVLEKSGVEYTMHGYGTNIEGPVSRRSPPSSRLASFIKLTYETLAMRCSGPK